jgi:phosphoglycolate phosphatase-like HAD superfamily hydrolase
MAAVRRSMSATSRVIPRLVVFDMDGTLTELGGLDFDKIRNRLRCPPGTGKTCSVADLELRSRMAPTSSTCDLFCVVSTSIRCQCGSSGILEFVTAQDASQQEALMAIVEEEERSALKDIALRPDAEAVLRTLKDRGER